MIVSGSEIWRSGIEIDKDLNEYSLVDKVELWTELARLRSGGNSMVRHCSVNCGC